MENKDIPNAETNIEEVKDLNTESILGEAKTEEKPKETMAEKENIESKSEAKERTYSQKEYEEGINKAIANKFKGYVKKAEAEDYEKVKSELETINKKLPLYKKGYDEDLVDFIEFTVSKMEGNYEENLEKYLESNKERFNVFSGRNKDTGVSSTNKKVEPVDEVTAILAKKHPNLYK